MTTVRGIDMPQVVIEDLVHVIADIMDAHPRSHQVEIGPSELGSCARRLLRKLAGVAGSGNASWASAIGTATHQYLERGMTARFEHENQPRYLLEHRVTVGKGGGKDISGNADVFDIDAGCVVDWKVVGTDRLNHYRDHGPGDQYRIQAHAYGRGFALEGHTVRHVCIIFLPRETELTMWDSLRRRRIPLREATPQQWAFHHWSEPYDESIAVTALARVDELASLLALGGLDEALALYPACDDFFCPGCRRDRARERQAPIGKV